MEFVSCVTCSIKIAIGIKVTFVSATIKIRIMLCLPCVFTAWANWHGAGVLSPALSLPWWQWQPAMAWHVKMTKHAKGYLEDIERMQHKWSIAPLRTRIPGHSWTTNHFAFRAAASSSLERFGLETACFHWALKEAFSGWKEEIRFFEDSKFVSSKGLNFFQPTRNKNGLHSSVPQAYVLCPALTCSGQ